MPVESRNKSGGQGDPAPSIDWVLVSSHFSVISADVDRHVEKRLFPSDHYPVTAVLRWN